ncbi:hypothetical protein EHQ71_18260, partial [Leptospira levettii]|uniref:hypothetical protein n=1 Tax=Leptospira levettii TaxID=2023178 RepID=UPI001084832A
MKDIFKSIQIEFQKKNYEQAKSIAFSHFSDEFFTLILKKPIIGIKRGTNSFSYSTFSNKITALHDNQNQLKLKSLIHLEQDYDQIYTQFKNRLKYHHSIYTKKNESLLKTYLSFTEFIFFAKTEVISFQENLGIFNHFSDEEIVESISTIIFEILENNFFDSSNFPGNCSTDFLKKEHFYRNIQDSIFLKKIKEFELKIKSFNFIVEERDVNTYSLFDPLLDSETSIRYGYVRTQLQEILFTISAKKTNNFKSLYSILKRNIKTINMMCELIPGNYSRIRFKMKLSKSMFSILKNLINSQYIYKEEYLY